MYKADCHLHTAYSFDSESAMADMAEAACARGFDEICFTDHVDFSYPAAEFLYPIDFDRYLDEIAAVRERFEGRMRVGAGIEFGIGPGYARKIGEILSGHSFDFVIGSFHDYRGADISYPVFYEGLSAESAGLKCLSETLEAIRTVPGFSVLGHMDYITRYWPYPGMTLRYDAYAGVIDEILLTLIGMNKGIEVNTSGYRYGLGAPHPSLEILRRFRELGGEIVTLGSDAHRPGDVGAYFDDGLALIREAGFGHICVFRDGKPLMKELGAAQI